MADCRLLRIASLAVVALAGLCLAQAPAQAAAVDATPAVELTAPRTAIGSAGAVVVRVTLSNPTAAPMRVLSWNTPADGMSASLFAVTRDGVPVPYLGPIAKRGAPTAGDYLLLEPGATRTYDVDLAAAYSFADGGDYEVRYRSAAGDLLIAGRAKIAGSLVSNALALAVDGRPDPVVASVTSATNPGCDVDTEEPLLTAALAAANTYATTAVRYFADNRSGARYQTWFGAYNLSRWQAVRAHYQSLASVTGGSSVRFTCHDAACGSGVFAFVYPNAPYMVYVCESFWSAPVTGTDSRAGTLIHELSHFTVVASTLDYVYGTDAARALAISNAGQATMNADNHEYFAENNPAQEVAAITVASTYDFGSQLVGTTSTSHAFTITNSGSVPIVMGTIATTGDFALTDGTCSGSTLAPAATCTVTATFAPTSAGALLGTISLPSNADVSPSTVALNGTGLAPTPVAAPVVAAAPAAVTVATAPVRVAARARNGARLAVTVGSGSAERWTFRIRARRGNGTWVVVATARAVPGGALRIIDLPKGQYQVVVDAGNGMTGSTSGLVSLRR